MVCREYQPEQNHALRLRQGAARRQRVNRAT